MNIPAGLDKLSYPDYVKERARIIDEYINSRPADKRSMLRELQAEVTMERALSGDMPETTLHIIAEKMKDRLDYLERIKDELKGLMK